MRPLEAAEILCRQAKKYGVCITLNHALSLLENQGFVTLSRKDGVLTAKPTEALGWYENEKDLLWSMDPFIPRN
jgi:DNA-binding transcriptional regulator YhcF (GntR family)